MGILIVEPLSRLVLFTLEIHLAQNSSLDWVTKVSMLKDPEAMVINGLSLFVYFDSPRKSFV